MLGSRRHRPRHSFSRAELLKSEFSWQNSYSLALASDLAYQTIAHQTNCIKLRKTAKQSWGFSFATPFDQKDTEGIVLADDKVVVLAFRGTADVRDWIGNLKLVATESPVGRVHLGFWRAYQNVESKLHSLLRECNASEKKLWICGHSLGGALAVLAGASLYTKFEISGVYTYGQPKLHAERLADTYRTHLTNRYVRFVNNNDIVPRIPPGYFHFGELHQLGDLPELRAASHAVIEDSSADVNDFMMGSDELTESEFSDLQNELYPEFPNSQSEWGGSPEVSMRPRTFGAGFGFSKSISDHSLSKAYIPAIEHHL